MAAFKPTSRKQRQKYPFVINLRVRRYIVKGTLEEWFQQVQTRKQRMIAGDLTDEEFRSARIEVLKMLFR